jgi:hypothetical protein
MPRKETFSNDLTCECGNKEKVTHEEDGPYGTWNAEPAISSVSEGFRHEGGTRIVCGKCGRIVQS